MFAFRLFFVVVDEVTFCEVIPVISESRPVTDYLLSYSLSCFITRCNPLQAMHSGDSPTTFSFYQIEYPEQHQTFASLKTPYGLHVPLNIKQVWFALLFRSHSLHVCRQTRLLNSSIIMHGKMTTVSLCSAATKLMLYTSRRSFRVYLMPIRQGAHGT